MDDFHKNGPESDEAAGSLRGRAALAIAWLALQLLRLIFLPFFLIGLLLQRKRQRHTPAKASAVKPLPTATPKI